MAPPISTNARIRAEHEFRRAAFIAFAKVFMCGVVVGVCATIALIAVTSG